MSSSIDHAALANSAKPIPMVPPVAWTERYFRLLWGTVGITGCLIAWQIGSSAGLLDPLFVSSPVEVLRTAIRIIPSAEFIGHVSNTAQTLFMGLVIAMIVGVFVGLPIGWFPRLNATFEPVIAAVYGVPYIDRKGENS